MRSSAALRLDRVARFGAAALVAGIVAIPFLLPLGGEHSGLIVLVGRLHPIVLHAPVTLLGLAPVLEIAGAFRRLRKCREYAGVTLALGAASAVPAMLAGYALAYGSGMDDPVTRSHMAGGVTLTVLAILTVLARRSWIHGRLRFVYPALLVSVAASLVWAAHLGGSLSHGETYLTEPLPEPVKRFFGMPVVARGETAAPGSAYALTVAPVFEHNCLSCHGPSKTKGGLRLDTFALLQKGGAHGPAVVAGNPEASEILMRVTLPENDRRVMPPDGKPLLKPEEIEALRAWVASGASPSAPPSAGVVVPKAKDAPTFEPVGDYSGLAARFAVLEKQTGVKLVPVSRIPGDGLILRTVAAPERFDDATLVALKDAAPFIVEAELDGTRVTDAAFGTLPEFSRLRSLRLARTAITGEGIARLSTLKRLTYLNLSQTKLTPEALAEIRSVAHVYAFDTPASPTKPVVNPRAKP